MNIKLELDELIECDKCGIVFNFYRNTIKTDEESDYQRTKIRTLKCPLCKNEFRMW